MSDPSVAPSAFLIRVDGREVVYDYGDYLLVSGDLEHYPHWLRFHYTLGYRPHAHLGSFPTISFLDWREYDRLCVELSYRATGNAILHMQAFAFLAGSAGRRDRDLYRRRKKARDALLAAYGSDVHADLEPQRSFWRRAADCLVSVHIPGSWPHSLDRGQHQLFGLGVCTISPEIWTATLDERVQPGEHYVPIRDDFSDLLTQIEWCRAHRRECRTIGQRAKAFFRAHSTPSAIWAHIQRRITGTE